MVIENDISKKIVRNYKVHVFDGLPSFSAVCTIYIVRREKTRYRPCRHGRYCDVVIIAVCTITRLWRGGEKDHFAMINGYTFVVFVDTTLNEGIQSDY